MIKLAILCVTFIIAVHAGVIPDHGHGVFLGPVAAPVVHAAPAVAFKAHGATSYANSNSISVNPHSVAVAPAPPAVVHAAPVAPVVFGHGFGPFYGHH